jgi:hypothetical protein
LSLEFGCTCSNGSSIRIRTASCQTSLAAAKFQFLVARPITGEFSFIRTLRPLKECTGCSMETAGRRIAALRPLAASASRQGVSDRCTVVQIAGRAVSETFMKSQRQRGG